MAKAKKKMAASQITETPSYRKGRESLPSFPGSTQPQILTVSARQPRRGAEYINPE